MASSHIVRKPLRVRERSSRPRLRRGSGSRPYTPDFEYHPPREFVDAGFFEPGYRGRAGYLDYMSSLSDVFGADLRLEPVELIDLGDRIVLLADVPVRAQASGSR